MKIYLVRHGQTTGDIENRYGGDYEDYLTGEGRKQAEVLATKLTNINIETIICSPRVRAQETAKIISEKLQSPILIEKNLRERNAYGILTGMIKKEAKEKHPNVVKRFIDHTSCITGAETYESFKKRVKSVFKKISKQNYQNVVILTHSGVIRCFVREVLKLGEIEYLGDCSFLELEKDGEYKLLKKEKVVL